MKRNKLFIHSFIQTSPARWLVGCVVNMSRSV